MSEQTTDQIISAVLRRHPDGVSARQLIGTLVGPNCTYSLAQQQFRDALSDGKIRVGWAGRLYAPKEQE